MYSKKIEENIQNTIKEIKRNAINLHDVMPEAQYFQYHSTDQQDTITNIEKKDKTQALIIHFYTTLIDVISNFINNDNTKKAINIDDSLSLTTQQKDWSKLWTLTKWCDSLNVGDCQILTHRTLTELTKFNWWDANTALFQITFHNKKIYIIHMTSSS